MYEGPDAGHLLPAAHHPTVRQAHGGRGADVYQPSVQCTVQCCVVYTMYNTLYGIAVASEFCGEVQPPNFQHNLFSVSHVL